MLCGVRTIGAWSAEPIALFARVMKTGRGAKKEGRKKSIQDFSCKEMSKNRPKTKSSFYLFVQVEIFMHYWNIAPQICEHCMKMTHMHVCKTCNFLSVNLLCLLGNTMVITVCSTMRPLGIMDLVSNWHVQWQAVLANPQKLLVQLYCCLIGITWSILSSSYKYNTLPVKHQLTSCEGKLMAMLIQTG